MLKWFIFLHNSFTRVLNRIKKLRTCKRSRCLLAPYTVDSDPESVWLTAGATSSVNRSTGLKRSQKNHSIMSAALGKDMHRRGVEVSEADQLSQPLYSYWGGGQGTAYSKNSGKAEFIFRSGSHWGIPHSWWLRELELDASWEMWKLQQVYRRAETQMRGEWNNLFVYLFILNRNHEWIIQTLLLLFKTHPLFQMHLISFYSVSFYQVSIVLVIKSANTFSKTWFMSVAAVVAKIDPERIYSEQ